MCQQFRKNGAKHKVGGILTRSLGNHEPRPTNDRIGGIREIKRNTYQSLERYLSLKRGCALRGTLYNGIKIYQSLVGHFSPQGLRPA